MDALIINDGVIVNVTTVETTEFAASQGWTIPQAGTAYAIGWVVDGKSFAPPAPLAPVVPDEVSAAQAKTALYQAGIYDDVEAVLGQAPDGLVRIWWQSAQTWRRDHPYILAVATFLDPPLDDDQVDALFVAAAAVPT